MNQQLQSVTYRCACCKSQQVHFTRNPIDYVKHARALGALLFCDLCDKRAQQQGHQQTSRRRAA
jgi:hypothetical protein